jgi:hypothetical protein
MAPTQNATLNARAERMSSRAPRDLLFFFQKDFAVILNRTDQVRRPEGSRVCICSAFVGTTFRLSASPFPKRFRRHPETNRASRTLGARTTEREFSSLPTGCVSLQPCGTKLSCLCRQGAICCGPAAFKKGTCFFFSPKALAVILKRTGQVRCPEGSRVWICSAFVGATFAQV